MKLPHPSSKRIKTSNTITYQYVRHKRNVYVKICMYTYIKNMYMYNTHIYMYHVYTHTYIFSHIYVQKILNSSTPQILVKPFIKE